MDEIIASPAMSPSLPPTLPPSRESCSPPSSPLSELSEFSKTPSPPSSPSLPAMDPSKRYPSPSATSQSGGASPRKLYRDGDRDGDGDGPPPAKRRRVQPPPKRPRMTRHLDLNGIANSDACEEELSHLLRALRKKKKIVVIAGAGISVSAGIPDFRSSTGLFTTLRGQHGLRGSGKHLFDASVYKHDSSTSSFHSMVRELAHMTQTAKPTAFHHMLASIAHEGRLMRLYSQNVDCIDTNMQPLATKVPLNTKGPWPPTIQLHGGLAKMVCSKCGQLEDFDGTLFEGPEPPPCIQCTAMDEVRTAVAGKRSHGIGRLRPRIVLYNEYNPDEEAIGNVSKADLRRGADAVIVVGTSLKIPGVRRLVKELCHTTRSRRDGFTAWINVDPEPQGAEFKDCWDLVVRGSSDDVARLAGLPHWDEPDVGSPSHWTVTGEEDFGLAKLEVVLDVPASSSPAKAAPSSDDETAIKEEINDTSKKALLPSVAKLKASQKLSSSPAASIPTPKQSPKPARKRLPDARQSTQSTLSFHQVKKADGPPPGTAKAGKGTNDGAKPQPPTKKESVSVKPAPAAPEKKVRHSLSSQQPRKARQPKAKSKKEDKIRSKGIALSFPTTKPVFASTPDGKKRTPLPERKAPRQPGSDKRDDHDVPMSADISELSALSDLSSPPDSLKRQFSADFTTLPNLRDSSGGGGGGPRSLFADKENSFSEDVFRCALDEKVRQPPSSLSREQREPCTPPASHSRRASDAETISPHSIPRGMGTLID